MCGKPAGCEHHLVFGRALRNLAEQDNLKLPMCNECHNLAVKAVDRIHGNSAAEKLSKMLGQALWERDNIVEYGENVRPEFIERYGRSYL